MIALKRVPACQLTCSFQIFGSADGALSAPAAPPEYITGADIARVSASLGAPMSDERIAEVMAECGVDGKVQIAI